ncbi:MAG: DUF1549 domain-containing protein, partial [Akkermansiaceae bacterium]|nr:DUF1549 domain-containing protein [Verrucomicrobiales bacterium]
MVDEGGSMRKTFCQFSVLTLLATTHGLLAASVSYERDIQPLLVSRCTSCHGGLKSKGALRLDAGVLMLKGGQTGPAMVSGKPGESLLLQRILSADPEERMPPEGKPLSAHESDMLREWIAAGTPFPKDEEIPSGPGDHWFFKQPIKATLPIGGLSHPIDAFLAQDWKKHGLTPQQPVEKGMLARRVYLDLVGVPPTFEELTAFLSDNSADGYERLVDKLLADSRYGQRWARHGMDIWRYSDEVLNPCDGKTPMYGEYHLWRWRDWIVESLNEGKPYDKMIVEMLAGDELAPEDVKTARATGYLVRNYNELGGRDAWLHDVVDHTSQAFLGLTMRCARCHDHKYDPIPHADYYKMRAVFEPMGKRMHLEPGFADPRKNGTPAAFDENLHSKTYLFENGNPQEPKKDSALPPGVPQLLNAGGIEPKPVKLPGAVSHPGRLSFVRDDKRRELSQALAKAQHKAKEQPSADYEVSDATLAELEKNCRQPTDAAPLDAPFKSMEVALTRAQVLEAEKSLEAFQAVLAADDAIERTEAQIKKLSEMAATLQREQKRRQVLASAAEALLELLRAKQDAKPNQEKIDSAKSKYSAARESFTKLVEEQKKPLSAHEPLVKSYPGSSTGR